MRGRYPAQLTSVTISHWNKDAAVPMSLANIKQLKRSDWQSPGFVAGSAVDSQLQHTMPRQISTHRGLIHKHVQIFSEVSIWQKSNSTISQIHLLRDKCY